MGTNYKHYFRVEITLFNLLLPFSSDCKKMQTSRMSYKTCRIGHFV